MKKVFGTILILLSIMLIITSCEKKADDDTDITERTALTYTSLSASDTIITVGAFTTLTATASGDELTYTWGSASGFGTVVGSGHEVTWSVCHSDVFYVDCEVQDKYGEKITKTVKINVKP